jgi:ribosomal protein S18 acetylase RimI-like enzyme
MQTTMVIGEPQKSELGLLFSLARATFEDVPGWSDEHVLAVLQEDLVFVAREDAQTAGYVALRHDPGDRTVTVDQLFVVPGHEQRGVGHRLLAHAEGWAINEHARVLRIVVEEQNARARRFYRRVGFVPVDRELLELILPQLPD